MSNYFEACPSCHGTSIHVAEWYTDAGEITYYCVCDDCGACDPDSFEEEYVAVDHWNRRFVPGYLDGIDPTDSEYDKLDESDWEDSDDYDEFFELEEEFPIENNQSVADEVLLEKFSCYSESCYDLLDDEEHFCE